MNGQAIINVRYEMTKFHKSYTCQEVWVSSYLKKKSVISIYEHYSISFTFRGWIKACPSCIA